MHATFVCSLQIELHVATHNALGYIRRLSMSMGRHTETELAVPIPVPEANRKYS